MHNYINTNEIANRYNSDGEIGLFYDAIENEKDFIDDPKPLVIISPNTLN